MGWAFFCFWIGHVVHVRDSSCLLRGLVGLDLGGLAWSGGDMCVCVVFNAVLKSLVPSFGLFRYKVNCGSRRLLLLDDRA